MSLVPPRGNLGRDPWLPDARLTLMRGALGSHAAARSDEPGNAPHADDEARGREDESHRSGSAADAPEEHDDGENGDEGRIPARHGR